MPMGAIRLAGNFLAVEPDANHPHPTQGKCIMKKRPCRRSRPDVAPPALRYAGALLRYGGAGGVTLGCTQWEELQKDVGKSAGECHCDHSQ
jgi:hypothetical protein